MFGPFQQQQQQQSNEAHLLNELEKKDLDTINEQELVDLISQQDIGSFAESLLKQIQADSGEAIDMNDIKPEVAGETPPHSSGDQDSHQPAATAASVGPKISTLGKYTYTML